MSTAHSLHRPRMSIGSWAFSFGPFEANPWSFSRFLSYAEEAGFDGIEINGFRPHPHPDDYDTPAKCAELVREIDGHGLGISGYAPHFGETPPSKVAKELYLQAVEKCLRFCERCGIGVLRVDTVAQPEPLATDRYESDFARLTDAWHDAAALCASSGVLLVWEFEPGFWLNKPSEVARTVDAVGHENFKLLFDTSHAYMGAVVGARQTGETETLAGGVAEYAKVLRDKIGHLHLIDSDGSLHDDETSTHAPFGEGFIDFKASLAPIADIVTSFEWWTTDFCFCAETETAAKLAPEIMRDLAEDLKT